MSEWEQHDSAGLAEQPAAADVPSAGTLLRRAREASGLHIAALAVSLKVPVRKLEALEGDRWDQLSDSVFVRALASSVCRTLKIDPQPVLERLPQNAAPRLFRVDEGINTPFHAPGHGTPPTWFHQLTKPVFLAVFALLLGALVLILLPTMQHDDGVAVAAVPKPAVVVTEAAPIPIPAPVPDTAATKISATNATWTATGNSAPVLAPALATTVVALAPATVPPAAAAAVPVASSIAPAAAPASAVAASGIVVFRAKGPTWVEVTDAKGQVGISKVLAGGEIAGASGALPLQVTIGRVDATEVKVRGKPFDLRPVSKDNVARFEVK